MVKQTSMKKLLISVSEPLDAWLRERAEADGISIAELVRRVLDEARKKEKK